MTVITINDTYPPSRVDNIPWLNMFIEESVDGVNTLGVIEEKSLSTGPGLVPLGLDTDPEFPISRDWTSTDATLPVNTGWYRVRFSDINGDLSEYSDWFHDAPHPWRPSIRAVASLIRSRAVDNNGNQLATFTNNTTPNAEQVSEIIDRAMQDLYPIFGDTIIDAPTPPYLSIEAYRQAVSEIAATRAALLIERTLFGKEVASGNSPYKQMWDDYRQQLLQIATKLGITVPGLTPVSSSGQTITPGSNNVYWGNEVTAPYVDMMTRPM